MKNKFIIRHDSFYLLGMLFLAACGSATISNEGEDNRSIPVQSPVSSESEIASDSQTDAAAATQSLTNVRIQDDNEYNFPFLIPFDGIFPVYDPNFVTADEAPLIEDELIIGVAWEGKAKAYPISVLRFREMVNDELAGIPTLVTW